MTPAERLSAFHAALAGHGQPDEVALARLCLELPPSFSGAKAGDTWAGALLAQVPPAKLRVVIDSGDWPMAAALADLAGDDPSSTVIGLAREHWGRWSPQSTA
jgi:hypothetical protein